MKKFLEKQKEIGKDIRKEVYTLDKEIKKWQSKDLKDITTRNDNSEGQVTKALAYNGMLEERDVLDGEPAHWIWNCGRSLLEKTDDSTYYTHDCYPLGHVQDWILQELWQCLEKITSFVNSYVGEYRILYQAKIVQLKLQLAGFRPHPDYLKEKKKAHAPGAIVISKWPKA